MQQHIVRLIEKKEIAEGTMAFSFERPKDFVYRAGQFIEITFIAPKETDAEGDTRAFSLASAPHESALMIATRMRDTAFKRCLRDLAVGEELKMTPAMGSFVLHNDVHAPAVFLIGGIGVTPVRSIILDALHRGTPHELYFFYSNRRPEDASFLAEFQSLAGAHPQLHFIPTMTQMEKSQMPWKGEEGYTTAEMVRRYLPDLATPIWYIAGPQAMTAAMRTMLSTLAIDEDRIRTEEFSGY